ncbi:MAG: NAD(P)-dependent oxidoreductase [Acidimicrobiaceae bacterium]|nr:NAD(P)-dependent oxidoreductase [Acidimicrobiaceae bacterium]MXZ66854.1 NAD(P)-dependent oxidoreductase [Acidimicrobiaceae bacterium]MYF32953.1 NAD(P)-dependent oxidoreductase [Acidimicrobiaceae bacterium]MYG76912.1 NAD(P)-dependent oxidoreductase [Acidimicrobiaceae bacterium]
MPAVGVVGLGVMGGAMAQHIRAAGHDVVGFDIEEGRAAGCGVRPAASPAEMAAEVDVVVFSLPSVESLREASQAVASARKAGLVVVETGTFGIEAKQEARTILEAAGAAVLDAPLSGTGLQAADATLIVYASGDPDAFAVAEPILGYIGQRTFYLGEFGNGSRMKFVANLLVSVHTLAAAEAHRLGEASGLDPQVVQEVIGAGVGSSKIFDIRGPMMASRTYEPPSARLAIIRKDSEIIAAHARAVGALTPLLDAALPQYRAAMDRGLGDLDAAVLHRHLAETSP